jgi:predicted DNA-binding transcriptional regulator AlpA
MPGFSIRGYARHRGVSHTAVRKALQTGRITAGPDGKIDAKSADRQWAGSRRFWPHPRASGTSTLAHREAERPEPDRMLHVEEAAAMLGVTKRWLYRHASTLTFTRRLSRKVLRFSRAGIAKWLATKRL